MSITLNEKSKTVYQPENTIHRVKHGGGSIMLWGCFTSAGTGPLVKTEGITGSSKFQTILAENSQAAVRQLKKKKKCHLPDQ